MGTSLKTCGVGAAGCLDWGAPVACPFGADSYPVCANGACKIGCNSGFSNCDGSDANGCEVATASDPANCKACGNKCGTSGGTAACKSGVCSITCLAGRADCDGANANGCEVTLASDGKNCGACGKSCQGGACSNGVCQPATLANGTNPQRIALDTDFVYWTNRGSSSVAYTDGWIGKVAKSGGATTTLASGVAYPHGIAVDDTYVYFTTLGAAGVAYDYPNGSIWRVAKNGGTPSLLASSQPSPWAVIVDASHVYFASGGTYWQSGGVLYYNYDGAIRRLAKSGGSLTTLAANQAEPVALAFTGWGKVAWVNRGGFDSSKAGPMMFNFSGNLVTLATGQPFPMSVAADLDYVYYPVHNGGIRKVPQNNSTGQLPTILKDATSGHSSRGIAVDASHVYWTESGDGSVRKVPLAGGATTNLTGAQGGAPAGLAIDQTAIYWVTEYSGTVRKLAK